MPGEDVALALFQLDGQQCFQIAQVGLALLDSHFRQRSTLLGHGWQT
jgi:hypothetical protein